MAARGSGGCHQGGWTSRGRSLSEDHSAAPGGTDPAPNSWLWLKVSPPKVPPKPRRLSCSIGHFPAALGSPHATSQVTAGFKSRGSDEAHCHLQKKEEAKDIWKSKKTQK